MPDDRRIALVEVGPRDGLQAEPVSLPVETRLRLISLLAEAGLARIEAGAFVSERLVPQMAETAAVLEQARGLVTARLSALTPTLRGFERALAAGAQEIAVPLAATESFTRANLHCSLAESMDRAAAIAASARPQGVALRGYVSCAFGCPYEGAVPAQRTAEIASELHRLGYREISLADTIGASTPFETRRVVEIVARSIPMRALAGHFHDTYGQALANIHACLESGMRTFDSSVAGLGGCPFAPGAEGNVATEDVVYMLRGGGFETGVDLDRLIAAGAYVCAALGREPQSRVARAHAATRAACMS
jgi:hydroxymethylglutaryl-CoA lyase